MPAHEFGQCANSMYRDFRPYSRDELGFFIHGQDKDIIHAKLTLS